MTDGRFADCRSSRMGDVTGWRMFASDEGGESGGRLQSAIGRCIWPS